MKRIWIKLFIEILDDPKMGRLPDWLWRRAIELFLLAGENGNDGLLQPVEDSAWRLRTSIEKLTESLQALSRVGVVHETPEGWVVSHFKERQYSESLERVRRYRNAKGNATGNEDVTDDSSLSISDSDLSLEREGLGEETKTALKLFQDHFGKFLSEKEIKRWLALFDAAKGTAEELINWAFKKEIHLENRAGLLDSMETAAKNWKVKTNGNGHHAEPRQDRQALGRKAAQNAFRK
jgi:hypothetical protein